MYEKIMLLQSKLLIIVSTHASHISTSTQYVQTDAFDLQPIHLFRHSVACCSQNLLANSVSQLSKYVSAGATEPAENGNEVGGSAAKRRRRSEDRDIGEAAADGISQGQVNGVVPVNGHAATEANGSVAPEAAFWSALEDGKDEVRACLSMRQRALSYAWSCLLFYVCTWLRSAPLLT